jgi:vacuolar-type H+-ATPase subunit H
MQRTDYNRNDPTSGDGVMQIGERFFRITEYGLFDEEVRSYIQELINQRDALLKRQEHMAALTELAEKTVIEANNLSQLMMKRSAEQAKADSDNILVKAEQNVQQMIEAKTAEAKATAEIEAKAIKTEAWHQANLIRREQIDFIRGEAASLAQKLQNDLLANIDEIKKYLLSIGTKFETLTMDNNGMSLTVAEKINEDLEQSFTAAEKGVLLNHIPWLEVEVLPPQDIEKIMDLISRLESLPEVKTTDLLPEIPNPLIRIFLNEPSPLAELLRTMPQIEQVMEMTDTTEFVDQNNQKRERIQVVLAKNDSIKGNQTKKGAANKSIHHNPA